MSWPGKHGATDQAAHAGAGEKKPNRWRLHNRRRGVWHSCANWYAPDYCLTSLLVDPQGRKTGCFNVVRGSSRFRHGKYARSACRRLFHSEQVDYVRVSIQDFVCRPVYNQDRNLPVTAEGQ